MEQTETTTGESTPPPTANLVRPLEGRMVAGVALALARRLELPEWAVRVAFIVTAFLGGLGVILYGAGWALIRSETESESAAERFFGRAGTAKSWVGIGLIALAAMIVFGQFSIFNDGFTWAAALLVVGLLLYSGVFPTPSRPTPEREPSPDPGDGSGPGPDQGAALAVTTSPQPPRAALPPTPTPPPPAPRPPRERSYLGRIAFGVAMLALGVLAILDLSPVAIDPAPRHYLALLTVVFGAALVVGAFRGRARFLILIGLVLVPALFVSPFMERRTAGSWTYFYSPTSFSELQSSYAIEAGRLELDLTSLPWDGEVVDVRIDGDAALIELWVPHGVALEGRLDANVGWLRSGSRAVGGIRPPTLFLDHTGEDPLWGTLQLDGQVDLGSIQVTQVYMERLENQP